MSLKRREAAGRFDVADGRLLVSATRRGVFYGVVHPTVVSGHFLAEVEFVGDGACGLALVQSKGGSPDPANLTSIWAETDENGKVVVQARDRQGGVDDVLDNTGSRRVRGAGRYRHVLDGPYSVPVDRTAKRLRILRDGPAGFSRCR